MKEFLVPVVDVNTRACDVIAVAAPSEAAAISEVLRNAVNLRYTGGTIERVELNEELSIKRDIWAERHRPAKEQVR